MAGLVDAHPGAVGLLVGIGLILTVQALGRVFCAIYAGM